MAGEAKVAVAFTRGVPDHPELVSQLALVQSDATEQPMEGAIHPVKIARIEDDALLVAIAPLDHRLQKHLHDLGLPARTGYELRPQTSAAMDCINSILRRCRPSSGPDPRPLRWRSRIGARGRADRARVPRRLFDTALDVVLLLELRRLGADEAKHHGLILRHEAKRLKSPARGRIVFQEIGVDVRCR